jgi:putative transposase
MARRPISIQVTSKDRSRLERFLRAGVQQVRVVLRALALRQLARGAAAPRVAQALPLTPKAVRQIAHRYNSGGLERALYDKQRPGAKPLLNDSQKRRVVAMVRGKPPEGRARWTVRLVAEEAVRRKLVPRAGRETIRVLLQDPGLKPRREGNVVRGGIEPGLHREK